MALSFFLAYLLLPLLKDMIVKAGFVRPNYNGKEVPLGVGLLFLFVPLFVFVLTLLFIEDETLRLLTVVYLFVTAIMALLGLIDDVFGSRETTGFKGHFKHLWHGRLTTGALKAIGGLVVAVFASLATAPWDEVVLNSLLIALAANTLNLLDLRPGRAGKGFLVGAALLCGAGWGHPVLILLATVTGTLLAYLPSDLKAEAMMGDTGSNVLGVSLGLVAVWILSVPTKIALVVALVAIHFLAEKYSFTRIIEGNRVLHFFDRLGRKEEFSKK
ncbi:MAG: hypothetical protein H0Z39_00675 [Peptococcaceae bacterium]|nr:hypothetical protein [Peptococcaceae bacterium]